MRAIETAVAKMPACIMSAYENLLADSKRGDNFKDLLDAVDHELTLYAEGQDGCITAKEHAQCVAFKKWLRSNGGSENCTPIV